MPIKDKGFFERLRDAYASAQKPISFVLMFAAVLLETLPDQFFPKDSQPYLYFAVLLPLAVILFNLLFRIHEQVIDDEEFDSIESAELLEKIRAIVSNERSVRIKCIGLAGRTGWDAVLSRLLDEGAPDSLISNRVSFEIDIALLDPKIKNENDLVYRRFDQLESNVRNIRSAIKNIPKIAASGSEIRLHFYSHMPNMLGFLVDDNYLFLTHAYWGDLHGEFTLRGAGTSYFIYDRNDRFGGQDFIRRFEGWFEHIVQQTEVVIDGED